MHRLSGSLPSFVGEEAGSLSAEDFAAEIGIIAAQLPESRPLINLCRNRRYFSALFLAAASRACINLLPPNESPGQIKSLSAEHDEAQVLDDAAVSAMLAHSEKVKADSPRIDPEQLVALSFTSGSTGQRSAHQKKWTTLVQTAQLSAKALMPEGFFSVLATVPAQHMYGLEFSVIVSMLRGAAVSTAQALFPADIAANLGALPKPRVLVTTPIHLQSLLKAGTDLPTIDRILSATAPLSVETASAIESLYGCPVFEVYGCTEAGSIATRRTVEGDWWTPHPDSEIRIGPDKAGRYRGRHLPEEIELADQIELDPDHGRFRLLGRHSDLIKIAGKRASLEELNRSLKRVERVQDAVVFPLTDQLDSRLAALVVAPGQTRQAILSALADQIDPVFLPRPLCLVNALPRDGLGKLSLNGLRDLLRAERG